MRTFKSIIPALLLLLSAVAHGQIEEQTVNLQNNGILYIANSSDTLFAKGDFTNKAGAALVNKGQLYVKRNLSNSEVGMQAGTGTLHLTGTNAQVITGAQTFKTYNLVTNNNAGILLSNNLSVTGLHRFEDGIISSATTSRFLVYEAGSSYTGATDNAHMSGWVKKIGNTAFTFPVGNGSVLRSATISNLSQQSEFNCKYKAPTINPTYTAGAVLLVDANEYWDMPRVSGGTADVTLNWNSAKVLFPAFDVAAVRLVQYSSSMWTNRGGSATGNVSTTGTLTSTGINEFGSFTFGSLDWFVPIKLLSFTAKRDKGVSQLDWKVTQEQKMNRYEVERSEDGINFRKIGTVAATNSTIDHSYRFLDPAAVNNAAWYRLRMVDQNEKHIYSAVVMVRDNNTRGGLWLINNPVYNFIYIGASENYAGDYNYVMFGANGQEVLKGKMTAQAGGIASIALTSHVTPGIYILNIRNNDHQFTHRVIVR